MGWCIYLFGVVVLLSTVGSVARFEASSLGYTAVITPEYIISLSTPPIEIALEEDNTLIEAVSVSPTPRSRDIASPVSMHTIGIGEIERSAGANRDIARIVRSLPGVAFSPIGYRNDLIVRGGGPSENTFYIDGVEIPNINHFATQGASGGPVSILNADLIRKVEFYTGAFPVDRGNALSSVMDISLRDGNPDKQRFKATLGASEAAFSGSGHFNERATYLFSIRQSYLQLLFKLLGLPFLPNYIDMQAKVRIRPSQRYEIVLLGLAGIDNMRLNTDEEATALKSYWDATGRAKIDYSRYNEGDYAHLCSSTCASIRCGSFVAGGWGYTSTWRMLPSVRSPCPMP